MLSEAQKQQFDALGFLVLRGLFSPEEMATIKREADEILAEERGNLLPNGRVAQQPFFEHRPFMAALPADDRIYEIGEDLLGPKFFLIGTEGNSHAGDTYWHGSGLWDEKIKAVKIAFYPERLTARSGSLRVVPGSHRRGSPDPLEPLRNATDDPGLLPFGLPQAELPHVALELEPGDLGVFTEELLHAAFGGHDGRHQHAVNFMEFPSTASKEKDVRDFYAVSKYSLRPSESYVNSTNPRLRRMVEVNLELGFDIMKGV